VKTRTSPSVPPRLYLIGSHHGSLKQFWHAPVFVWWPAGNGVVAEGFLQESVGGRSLGGLLIVDQAGLAEHKDMAESERIHTYDDDLHERRRQLAVAREPIDFQNARLKRLLEKARDTRDP
jgi:hypothetical protein